MFNKAWNHTDFAGSDQAVWEETCTYPLYWQNTCVCILSLTSCSQTSWDWYTSALGTLYIATWLAYFSSAWLPLLTVTVLTIFSKEGKAVPVVLSNGHREVWEGRERGSPMSMPRLYSSLQLQWSNPADTFVVRLVSGTSVQWWIAVHVPGTMAN